MCLQQTRGNDGFQCFVLVCTKKVINLQILIPFLVFQAYNFLAFDEFNDSILHGTSTIDRAIYTLHYNSLLVLKYGRKFKKPIPYLQFLGLPAQRNLVLNHSCFPSGCMDEPKIY